MHLPACMYAYMYVCIHPWYFKRVHHFKTFSHIHCIVLIYVVHTFASDIHYHPFLLLTCLVCSELYHYNKKIHLLTTCFGLFVAIVFFINH